MGKIKRYPPVKLFFGFTFKDEEYFLKVLSFIEKRFGKLDLQSLTFDFSFTDYYEKEFGLGLKKKFISMQRLIDAGFLSKVKIFTNKIEKKFSKSGLRLINIDPGLIDLAKIVLASTKDFSHRISLGKGIFAEITLIYQDKNYRALDWTYPDYKSTGYMDFFKKVREIYAKQIKGRRKLTQTTRDATDLFKVMP